MNEIGFQNNISQASGVKDRAQKNANKKADTSFKGILEKISSETSSTSTKNMNAMQNSADNLKAESVNDSNVEGTKAKFIDSEKAEITDINEEEVIDDSKPSIALSSKEIAELKSVIAKLHNLDQEKIGIEDKANINLENVIELLNTNLVKIEDVLNTLKNPNLSIGSANNEIQSSKTNLDLINVLSNLKDQITDILNVISTAKVNSSTIANKEEKDALNIDLSEHSMNPEKSDTKDSETKNSDNMLAISGMALILSEIAVLKTEQLKNSNISAKAQAEKPLKDLETLNNSITAINELLKKSTDIRKEGQDDFAVLRDTALKVLSNKTLSVKDNLKAVQDKSNISILPKAEEAVSEIVKMVTNNSEDLKLDSETLNLINKFIGNADELEHKLTQATEINKKETMKTVASNGDNPNNIVDVKGKINTIVKKHLMDRDLKIDIEKSNVATTVNKLGTQYSDGIEGLKQNSAIDQNMNKSTVSEENKLLLKLSSEDKDSNRDDVSSKITRVTNFATSLQTDKNLPLEHNEKVPVINRQTFNNDLIKSFKYMELNDVKELTVKIMPKELGELFIKITREGEVVKAQITATNKEAYNALNSNLTDITNKLSEQNIKIHSFTVDIFNGDSSYFNQGSNNQNGNSQGKRRNSFENLGIEDISDNSEDILKELNNLNALA